MINVVTWLDSNKYRSEISAVCAGNGIRIVADEFEGAQDFLRTFDSIDANIDVLVFNINHHLGLAVCIADQQRINAKANYGNNHNNCDNGLNDNRFFHVPPLFVIIIHFKIKMLLN